MPEPTPPKLGASVHALHLADKLKARSAKIGVIGMGYVGLPLAEACVNSQFTTLGFDIDKGRVRTLNEGQSPIRTISNDTLKSMLSTKLFVATDKFDELKSVDIVIICVPTPLTKNREPDLAHVEATANTIQKSLRPGQLVILESTTWPGTTEQVVRPILLSKGLDIGSEVFLAYSPEREDPGNLEFNTRRIPRVVGADDTHSLELAKLFYEAIVDKVVTVSSTRTAEAVKITENTFRAVNIALVNELKQIYYGFGIDPWETISAAATKPFGFMPFYPGPGVGGHCIPVDPFYLTWKAREIDLPTRFIELAGEINSRMPYTIVNALSEELGQRFKKSLFGSNILVVGMAFKRDVEDVRESPAVKIFEILRQRGASASYFDPYVTKMPESHVPEVVAGLPSVSMTKEVFMAFDAAIIATDHSNVDYSQVVDWVPLTIDTRNATKSVQEQRHKIVKA